MQGQLVRATNGRWMTQPADSLPQRPWLGPNQVLVGHQACLGHGGGHTTWTCRKCDQTVYGPPLYTHSTALSTCFGKRTELFPQGVSACAGWPGEGGPVPRLKSYDFSGFGAQRHVVGTIEGDACAAP